MARYRRDYSGEKRTEALTIQLTPSERTALEAGAARKQASLSHHARELCMRRSAAAEVVAGTRRDPEIRALMTELTAIGNNLNQLTKLANTDKATPQQRDLKATTELVQAAIRHVLKL